MTQVNGSHTYIITRNIDAVRAGIAQFERNVLSESVKSGLAKHGICCNRPRQSKRMNKQHKLVTFHFEQIFWVAQHLEP